MNCDSDGEEYDGVIGYGLFDKLDEIRVGKIIDMVNNDNFGQLFISDTHPERTEQVVKQTNQSYKIVHL